MTTNNKVTPVLERITQLENGFTNLANELEQSFETTRQTMTSVAEVMAALIQVLGGKELDDKVKGAINDARVARMREQADRAKTVLQSLLDQGALVAVDAIGENSILTGRETDKQGALVEPGYAQAPFAQFSPGAKEAFTGKGIGAIFEGPVSNFEVTGVYEYAPQAPAEQLTAPAEATVEAPQEEPTV